MKVSVQLRISTSGSLISLVGCLAGALSCLWIGDILGRRKVIWIGSIIMVVGAIIQTSSFTLAQLVIGRVIGGIGNGMHTATIPMWQSECSPPHKRGMVIMVEGLLITGGICMAYWIDFAFYWIDPSSRYTSYDPTDFPYRSAAWRVPVAWQILLIIPTFFTIWMPESPRWLLLKGREDDARAVLAALDELPLDDPRVTFKVKEIQQSLDLAGGNGVGALFRQGPEKNFHRAALGFIIQMFQQITGINLITYYAGTLFQTNLGMSATVSRVVAACNGTEYFIASFIAVYTIEMFGRRKLMLFGALGQSATMAVLAGVTSPAALNKDASGHAQNHGAAVAAAAMLFIFNTFFAGAFSS
jgi:sugar porter (SP) family MFS transporter